MHMPSSLPVDPTQPKQLRRQRPQVLSRMSFHGIHWKWIPGFTARRTLEWRTSPAFYIEIFAVLVVTALITNAFTVIKIILLLWIISNTTFALTYFFRANWDATNEGRALMWMSASVSPLLIIVNSWLWLPHFLLEPFIGLVVGINFFFSTLYFGQTLYRSQLDNGVYDKLPNKLD